MYREILERVVALVSKYKLDVNQAMTVHKIVQSLNKG